MCFVTRDPIDIAALAMQVAGPDNGAVVTFVGQTRNRSRGQAVAYLEYDAYVPMAEKLIARIAEDARERWHVNLAIAHRIGRVGLGEASVVICVGSPHRDSAYEASRYCIDTLKETVPIWKKEVTPEGAFWIEGADAIRAEP